MKLNINSRIKTVFFIAIALVSTRNVEAQILPDPFVNSATVAIAPTAYLETQNSISFQFLNVSPIGTLNLFPPTTLTIQLSKMDVLGTFNAANITGTGAGFFSWTYNPSIKMITGTLTSSVPPLTGGLINITGLIVTDSATIASPQIGFNVNVNATGSNNASTTNDFTSSYTYTQGSPLPVEWLGFEVNRFGKFAHLNWTTAHESNVSHFTPEFSLNGIDFTELADVSPKNSTIRNDYTYMHDIEKYILNVKNNPVLYYRVKQYDHNQQFSLTSIKKINLSTLTDERFAVYSFPNPAIDILNVYVDGINLDDAVFYKLLDLQGKIVFEKKSVTDIVSDYITIPVGSLARGTYMLKVKNDQIEYLNKILLN